MTSFQEYLIKKNKYYFNVYILSICLILPITAYLNIKAFLVLNLLMIGITGGLWCLGDYYQNEEDEKENF